MKVRESLFASTVPWGGIIGKPPFLGDGPTGNIAISDVQGLTAALASKQPAGSLARVATSGNYADLSGKPVLGTAAFVDASEFVSPSQMAAALLDYPTIPQVMARVFCGC